MRLMYFAGSMVFVAARALSPPPVLAAAHSETYNRALSCAANAEFMIHTKVDREGEQPSDWTEKTNNKVIAWTSVAHSLGEGSPADLEHDYAVLLSKSIPDQFHKLERTSDPVKDDPFTDSIVRFYENCTIHPPAPPATLQAFERWIGCSAILRFYGYTLQLEEPQAAQTIAETNRAADHFVEIAVRMTMGNEDGFFQSVASKDDAFFAHDMEVDRRRKLYESLSEQTKRNYMKQIQAGLVDCLKYRGN